jgi:DNA-binding LytR/AlgR family response regulator
MMLSCLIIDDEPLARKGLREYIQDVDFLRLDGEFENPMMAIETLLHQPTDLLFLDIEMPKLTGLDFLSTLSHPPLVVFTTAYPHYAVEGFNLDAVDYLVKPFSFERFLKAVVKVKARVEGEGRVAGLSSPPLGTEPSDHFFIKSENKLLKIRHEDLLFAEALRNYVVIHTVQKKYITYLTFRTLEEYLPASSFLRVHKSFIVSLSKIDSIEGNELRIRGQSVPIGRTAKEDVINRILKDRFLKK